MPMKFLGRKSAADDQNKDVELVEIKNSSNYFQAMAFVNAISGNASALCLRWKIVLLQSCYNHLSMFCFN